MATAEPAYLAVVPPPNAQADQKTRGSISNEHLEPISLSSHSSHSQTHTNVTPLPEDLSIDSQDSELDEKRQQQETIKCSAVHTLERDMPDYDYSDQVRQLRQLILDFAAQNEGMFSQVDVEKCRQDDWFLSRFLLRQKMDLKEAFEMLKKAMRFNHESLASIIKPEDFPSEFYQLGGLFHCGKDRRGNRMLYMRVRVHRKAPEINSIVQTFIYSNIRRLDEMAQGRGISLVIDCQGAGLASADMETLIFIISTLKNYFPKGLSYFLVHELPWILKPFWHLAKNWVPHEHRQLIKFSDSRTVFEYIDQDQLPDFMGGTVGEAHYKLVPEGCTHFSEAAKLWGIEKPVMRRVLDRFKENLPEETVMRIEEYFAAADQDNESQSESVDVDKSHHVTNEDKIWEQHT